MSSVVVVVVATIVLSQASTTSLGSWYCVKRVYGGSVRRRLWVMNPSHTCHKHTRGRPSLRWRYLYSTEYTVRRYGIGRKSFSITIHRFRCRLRRLLVYRHPDPKLSRCWWWSNISSEQSPNPGAIFWYTLDWEHFPACYIYGMKTEAILGYKMMDQQNFDEMFSLRVILKQLNISDVHFH